MDLDKLVVNPSIPPWRLSGLNIPETECERKWNKRFNKTEQKKNVEQRKLKTNTNKETRDFITHHDPTLSSDTSWD